MMKIWESRASGAGEVVRVVAEVEDGEEEEGVEWLTDDLAPLQR